MKNQEKTTLEIIAPTVEEAIEKGLEQLGLREDEVGVEILDNGSKGLLGLGGRQSRIRLTVNDGQQKIIDDETTIMPENGNTSVDVELSGVIEIEESNLTSEDLQDLKTAKSVVVELLDRMRVKAEVKTRYIEPQDNKDRRMVLVDIEGKDLSILIGRRSETLNALQYIASLIISKELNRWVPLLIDVQGYRTRRERQLRQLGKRMAEQALESGRKQTLEPMPANERRIIHLELRDHPKVYTESAGEEPYRKVVILLKD